MLRTGSHRLDDKIATLGLTHSAQLAVENVIERSVGRAARRRFRRRMVDGIHAGFDRRNAVDTRMPEGSPSEPTDATTFANILRLLDVDPRAHDWIDVGCGKGRTVLLAAEARFRRVIGVELDPQLVGCARRNLSRSVCRERREELRIVQADICDYDLPRTPQVLFCFNPFGADVMRMFLQRVVEPGAKRRIVVYYNAVHREVTQEFCGRGLLRARTDVELLYGDCLILETVANSTAASQAGAS